MHKRILLLSALCLCQMPLFSEEEEEVCGYVEHTQRLELKHVEFKGIGYKEGYTSLEGFFTVPNLIKSAWTPFLDVRAHIFNQGKPAANAGVGLRYLSSMVWGLNAYYDYRKGHYHYNQAGFGVEALGKIWDFRLNTYFPIGKTHSVFFHTRFHAFKGHRMIVSRTQEFAMKGANAEVGAHALDTKNYRLYAALGPYYLEQMGKMAWGGQGRLALSLFECARLQLSGSWDRAFGAIAQGELSVMFAFGGEKKIKQKRYSCSWEMTMRQRALQRVDRFEIIVIDQRRKHFVAKSPITHEPYTFWFVDNTSHSNGTYESPFTTLAAAQNASSSNDVIYVFPGNETDAGMSSGITLKSGQFLFGSGRKQSLLTTFGNVSIPRMTSAMPIISNSSLNVPVIQLSTGSNQVAGIHIQQTQANVGIATPSSSSGGNSYVITQNHLYPANGMAAIELNNTSTTTISRNTFQWTDFTGASAIYVGSSASGSVTISSNLMQGISATVGFTNAIDMTNIAQPLSFTIQTNLINFPAQPITLTGIAITTNFNVPIKGKILGNALNIPNGVGASTTGISVTDTAAPFELTVSTNTITAPPGITGYSFINTAPPGFFQLDFSHDNVGTRSGP